MMLASNITSHPHRANVSAGNVSLNIGEFHVTKQPIQIVCRGLGSCVALFMYDITTTTVGGVHILMPGECDNSNLEGTCYSYNALESLITRMRQMGSDLKNLRAKIVGGANVVGMTHLRIGNMIIDSLKDHLKKKEIEICGIEVGGAISRTARFCSNTRIVEVTSAYSNTYKFKI